MIISISTLYELWPWIMLCFQFICIFIIFDIKYFPHKWRWIIYNIWSSMTHSCCQWSSILHFIQGSDSHIVGSIWNIIYLYYHCCRCLLINKIKKLKKINKHTLCEPVFVTIITCVYDNRFQSCYSFLINVFSTFKVNIKNNFFKVNIKNNLKLIFKTIKI